MSKRDMYVTEEVMVDDKIKVEWVTRAKTHENKEDTKVIEETNPM
jgi:hypothetical protein